VGLGSSQRTKWLDALDFEVPIIDDRSRGHRVLYWVGCAGSLDERGRKQAVSTARMLHRAGVNFGILGPRESCTGDRRVEWVTSTSSRRWRRPTSRH